jgi:hypothetical protein
VENFHVPRVWRKPQSGLRAAAVGGVRRAKPAAKRAFCHGIVKNQQGLTTELLHISRSAGFALLDFHPYRDKASSENFSRAARLAQTAKRVASSSRRRRSAGEAQAGCPRGNPNAAFCHGIAKVQQGSAAELLQISRSEGFRTSEFHTIP